MLWEGERIEGVLLLNMIRLKRVGSQESYTISLVSLFTFL